MTNVRKFVRLIKSKSGHNGWTYPRPETWLSAASDFNWVPSRSHYMCFANMPLWEKNWTGRSTRSFLHQSCWPLLTSCYYQFYHNLRRRNLLTCSNRVECTELMANAQTVLPCFGVKRVNRVGIFGSNFFVSEKRDRKRIERFGIEMFRFCKVFAPAKRLKNFRYFCPPNTGSYVVYARSPSPSQRPAPTMIASRSPFSLGLCSC